MEIKEGFIDILFFGYIFVSFVLSSFRVFLYLKCIWDVILGRSYISVRFVDGVFWCKEIYRNMNVFIWVWRSLFVSIVIRCLFWMRFLKFMKEFILEKSVIIVSFVFRDFCIFLLKGIMSRGIFGSIMGRVMFVFSVLKFVK